MTYQEKRSIVHLLSAILVPVIYFWFVFSGNPTHGMNTDELLYFWARTILISIPVTIVAHIIIAIVFGISSVITSREKIPKEDERDKMIELKAMQASRYVFGFGVVLAMGALVGGMSVNMMFLALVGSGVLSGVVEQLSKLYFYRNGI